MCNRTHTQPTMNRSLALLCLMATLAVGLTLASLLRHVPGEFFLILLFASVLAAMVVSLMRHGARTFR